MPTEQQLMDAASRRQARRAAREQNTEKAQAEQHELAIKSQEIAEAKAEGTFEPPVKPMAKKTRAQQLAAQREAAKKQADEDSRLVPAKVELEGKLAAYRERGEVPPLHMLNALAAEHDHAVRDEARQIANAAGKAAFDLAVGRRGRHDTVNRHRRMRDQIAIGEKAKPQDDAK